MNITYTLPLPDAIADTMIEAFASQHGWTSASEVTALEHSRLTLNAFVRDSVSARLSIQAAEQAKQAALNSLTQQFDGIASTISE
jgi:hypothetical protein